MLRQENFAEEHIRELQKASRRDPNEKLKQELLIPLRYFRKANPEAYAYIVQTDRLLSAT